MFLSVENIKTLKSNKYISEKAFEKNFKIFPEQGDILMTRIGDIGTTNIVQTSKRLGYYVSLALLKPKNIASHFLNSVIATPSFQISLKRRSLLTATPQKVNKDEIGKVYFFISQNLQEQEKIGQLFQSLNKTITLHEEQHRQLEQLKKALLQKMFADETGYPALRFKGFTEKWEQRKLGEIATIVGGGTPSTKNSEYWDGDINWYSPAEIGNQIYTVKSERQITELGLKKSSAKLLPVGTVLFTSRAGIGKTAILNKEACTNQGFQSIIPRPQILNSYFLFSRTNSLKQYGETMGSGSTFVEVSGKQMSKMPLFIPDINEQTRIAKLFQSLDKTITLHDKKIQYLKQLKRGLLQKMFV